MSTLYRIIGMMSGTSMDGIDAVLVETDGEFYFKQIATYSRQYNHDFRSLLKKAEQVVKSTKGDMALAYQQLPELKDVIHESTMLHYEAVRSLMNHGVVDLIGYHGQTLYHAPGDKITIQIADAPLLAKLTNITVIGDFRIADIRNGGEGAPLAPIYHQMLAVRDNYYPTVILNSGGIANLSLVYGADSADLVGFDAGPGNCLLDRYIAMKTGEPMDRDGKYGMRGEVNNDVLEALWLKSCTKAGYFNLPPPKSLDVGDFILIDELFDLSIEDAAATLAAFTADVIVKSVGLLAKEPPKRWVLAGGGWLNPKTKLELQQRLTGFDIKHANEIGWDSKYMEAEIFAYLAVKRIKNAPVTFEATTGVLSPTICGEVYSA